MDKSELKEKVRRMTEEEREELGHLLLESVLERMNEEEREATAENAAGPFEVIVDEPEDPSSTG